MLFSPDNAKEIDYQNSHKSKITDNALTVLKNRYFHKDSNGNIIEDWNGLCKRVAKHISSAETNAKERNKYRGKFYNMLKNLDFLPNTPTLINAGKESGLSACYVYPLYNFYDKILEAVKDSALISKSGGGVGYNFTEIKLDRIIDFGMGFYASLDMSHPDYELFKNTNFKHLKHKKSPCDIMENGQIDITPTITLEDNIASIFNFEPLLKRINEVKDKVKYGKLDDRLREGEFSYEYLLIDFSKIRPKDSPVNSTNGVASGPVSFMKVWDAVLDYLLKDITPITTIKLFDICTDAIKQGGVRRGANMGVLNCDSEYILEFIKCKEKDKEISNFNLSVGLFDDIIGNMYVTMRLKDYSDNSLTFKKLSSAKLMDIISEHACLNGEPGVIFLDTVNKFSPIRLEKITATNPCGEQPLLDYESCNLGSINLVNMVKYNEKECKYELNEIKFIETIHNAVRFLDNVIDVNVYPIDKIAETTKRYRKIGLGVMGLADMFYLLNIPYDSDEAIKMSEHIGSILAEASKEASTNLGIIKGDFPYISVCDLLKLPPEGHAYPFAHDKRRNATTTTIAPTGTIGLIASVSSGIEPNFANVYIRNAFNNTKKLLYVNRYLKNHLLKSLNIEEDSDEYNKIINKIINNNGSVKGIEEIPEDIQRLYVCTRDISMDWHIKHQAAWQKYIDNAISKTINCQKGTTKEQVKEAYIKAYESGCKGITVYVDGSRDSQVLTTKIKEEDDTTMEKEDNIINEPEETQIVESNISDRPEELKGVTFKVQIGCGTLYVTINYNNGSICEVFTNTGKSGGCPSQSEATARLASMALRSGVPVEELIRQLKGIRCMSTIKHAEHKALSCPDAIARCLIKMNNILNEKKEIIRDNIDEKETSNLEHKCPDCGSKLEFEGGCRICKDCGYSKCG